MRIGVIFPHFEFGNDPSAIRDYAQTAEGLGYSHIGADDHVIGPNPQRPGGWNGWVTYKVAFHEPLTLFSFMAAVTERIELETCVLLLPQRQTVLVAKQAVEVDILSGGRLRLGVGNGWSTVEYQSLNADFHTRGRRMEEQIEVLRRLWTQPLVDFQGRWHTIPDAGINPLPVQRPIPIWFGGQSTPVIERAARLGDGWMPLYKSPQEASAGLEQMEAALARVGRTLDGFGLEARLPYGKADPTAWQRMVSGWEAAGWQYLSLVVTDSGLEGPAAHIQALSTFARAVGLKAETANLRTNQ